jgi:nicotinamide riboside kinase
MEGQLFKIVITGAESTGKSSLARSLSEKYGCPWVPELARNYIENLDRHYTYNDIEVIAKAQIEAEQQFSTGIVIFDTWLIITKVWFDFVYGKHPEWLDYEIRKGKIDLFLLCDIDLPWISDPVRENGGENRKILHQQYQQEIESYGFTFSLVKGAEQQRVENAIQIIENKLYKNSNQLKINIK